MHGLVGRLPGRVMSEEGEEPLGAAAEEHLAEGSRLAFRVAWSVLRQREDAEDVAQEAMARACRHLSALCDRERFRPWLVRIAWRLALNHRRASQRRERREQALVDLGESRGVEDLAAASEFRAPASSWPAASNSRPCIRRTASRPTEPGTARPSRPSCGTSARKPSSSSVTDKTRS